MAKRRFRRTTAGLLVCLALALVALSQRARIQRVLYGVGRKSAEQVGKVAPELPASVAAQDGALTTLRELRGKVVLLHFWTFSCSNCKRMLPKYAAWKEQFAARGLAVLGVHTPETDEDRDPEKLAAFIKEHRISWPMRLDPDYEAWNLFRVDAWPTTLVIDRGGILRGSFVGDDQADEIQGALEKLL